MEVTNKKKKKKRRLKPWVYYTFLMIFISCFIAAGIHIALWAKDNYKSQRLKEQVIEISEIKEDNNTENEVLINPPPSRESDYWYYTKMPMIDINFNELLSTNSDTVAWIQVAGTNINYPVVQARDNEYYLTHAFDKSKNSAGWVFSDYRNTWDNLNNNTIIYGHGRLDKTVFGSLKNVLTNNWQNNKDNFVVKMSTNNTNMLWQIFSVYTYEAETYYLTNYFSTTKEYQTFIDTIKNRSVYEFNTEISTDDKILTLSTCTADNTGRIVLHAKLIKTNPK